MDGMLGEERLSEIAVELRAGRQPSIPTVREFLAWFGVQRRGISIIKQIRRSLRKAGLLAPDFESAYIDSPIYFQLRTKSSELRQEQQEVPSSPNIQTGTERTTAGEALTAGKPVANDEAAVTVAPIPVTVGESEPIYQLRKLKAANKPPLSVTPDASVKHAATLMLVNNFSQLPVMSSPHTVKGIVTWASIGARLALGRRADAVRDVMDTHHELRADTSIFQAIPIIVQHNCVLVRGPDNRISGIVTSTDLNEQFALLTEPFLLLGDIEHHIRRIIDGHFSADELALVRDPADGTRVIEYAADLSFGEYIRLLDNPERWQKLTFSLDREAFCAKLDRVRMIRNDVMHFDPDGIPTEDLSLLRDFIGFLQRL
jgi:CBS domain-containing protein